MEPKRSKETVARWARGDTVPSALDIEPLATALGVTVEFVTGWLSQPPTIHSLSTRVSDPQEVEAAWLLAVRLDRQRVRQVVDPGPAQGDDREASPGWREGVAAVIR